MGSLLAQKAGEANPNLPHDVLPLDAFNLMPGAAFMLIDEPDPAVWIAERVSRSPRDIDDEHVFVWAHDGTDQEESVERSFEFHYCTKVALVGLVLNYTDHDDNNWGAA